MRALIAAKKPILCRASIFYHAVLPAAPGFHSSWCKHVMRHEVLCPFFKNNRLRCAFEKNFAVFLSLLLILGICPMSALADTGVGDGRGKWTGWGHGTGTPELMNREADGKVTVIYPGNTETGIRFIDLTSKTPAIKIHFGKVSKSNIGTAKPLSPTTSSAMLMANLRCYNAEDHQHRQ